MAAFVINLAQELDRLRLYIESGVYGTRVSPEPRWSISKLMTLADYLTMRPGDLIFFFQRRMIYGIGRVVNISPWPDSPAALCNFPASYGLLRPSPPYLWMGDNDPEIRWRVFFEPNPSFFVDGVDMDEVLQADTAGACRGLPLFWNRSFIKVEDDEANLIAHAILRRNYSQNSGVFASHASTVHSDASSRIRNQGYAIDTDVLVGSSVRNDNVVSPEGILHIWLADRLTRKDPYVAPFLGDWDFVCNLYPASPQKPRAYMDEIDIFGYSLVKPPDLAPYVRSYKIVEVKRDLQVHGQGNVVDQAMKYVDWIAATRAGGDYGLVDAYVVARGFTAELVEYARQQAIRHFVIPRRPYETKEWQGLRLVSYEPTGARPSLQLVTIL